MIEMNRISMCNTKSKEKKKEKKENYLVKINEILNNIENVINVVVCLKWIWCMPRGFEPLLCLKRTRACPRDLNPSSHR